MLVASKNSGRESGAKKPAIVVCHQMYPAEIWSRAGLWGGQVTALITGPIVISAAISVHASPQAMAVATAIGCSASFFTPIAHPVNILMIGPANYRFSDFIRLGWGLSILCFVLLVVGMKLFWGL